MTEQNKKEIIKSFAYGMTAEQVAAAEEIGLQEADAFQIEHAAEIAAMNDYLKEQEMM